MLFFQTSFKNSHNVPPVSAEVCCKRWLTLFYKVFENTLTLDQKVCAVVTHTVLHQTPFINPSI